MVKLSNILKTIEVYEKYRRKLAEELWGGARAQADNGIRSEHER